MAENPDEVIAPDTQADTGGRRASAGRSVSAECSASAGCSASAQHSKPEALDADTKCPRDAFQVWREQLIQRFPELQAMAHIREQPFASDKPIIGRLVVFVRETWNSIATKWYVRPMLRQQITFNVMVAQVTQELMAALQASHEALQASHEALQALSNELDQRVINGDRDVTLLARKIAEGEYRLRQWDERAARERADLTQRLSRLEGMLAMGNMGHQGKDE
jgi:hypothetical protein